MNTQSIIEGPEYDNEVTVESYEGLQGLLEALEAKARNTQPKVEAYILDWHERLKAAGLFHYYSHICANLLGMIAADKRLGEDRAPFHLDEPDGSCKIKPLVRALGASLDAIGGLGLMQAAHFQLQMQPEALPGDGSSLEYAWKGIGEWS